MQLNHINLPVTDVAAATNFFIEYFDLTCSEVKGDNALTVLTDNAGFSLVLMSQAFNRTEIAGFPSAFHIGFLLHTKEEVIDQYNKLKLGGIHLENEPANMRGVFGFYFIAPGGVLVEVSSKNEDKPVDNTISDAMEKRILESKNQIENGAGVRITLDDIF